MSSDDMKALGLENGVAVKISDGNGVSITLKVKGSQRAGAGYVIVPKHFSEAQVNLLCNWDAPVPKVKVEKA